MSRVAERRNRANRMALLTTPILAEDDFKLSNLLYLLVFFVLPLLSSLGAKLRKKFDKGEGPGPAIGKLVEPPKRAKRVASPVQRGRAAPEIGKAGGPKSPPIGPARPVKVLHKPVVVPPRAEPAGVPARRLRSPDVARPAEPRPARRLVARRPMAPHRKAAAPEPLVDRASTLLRPSGLERPETTIEAKPASPRRALLPDKIDAESLRAAIILSEILCPPLALREDFYGGSQL